MDELSWEERFWVCYRALCQMEARAEAAEAENINWQVFTKFKINPAVLRAANAEAFRRDK